VTQEVSTYQLVVPGQQLYIVRVTHEQLAHEVEVLDRELVAVVHELYVLFTNTPLYHTWHLHLTRTVLCNSRNNTVTRFCKIDINQHCNQFL